MNTSMLIMRLIQLAARPFVLLWRFLEKIALAVFGRLQWSPPQGLYASCHARRSGEPESAFLFTLKFDETGNWKIVKTHRMSKKEFEEKEQ